MVRRIFTSSIILTHSYNFLILGAFYRSALSFIFISSSCYLCLLRTVFTSSSHKSRNEFILRRIFKIGKDVGKATHQ